MRRTSASGRLALLCLFLALGLGPPGQAYATGSPAEIARIKVLAAQAQRALDGLRANEALQISGEAYDRAQAALGLDDPITLQAGLTRAGALRLASREKEGLGLMGRLSAAAERRLGDGAPLTVTIRREFAQAAVDTEPPKAIEQLLMRQVVDSRRVFGPHASQTAQALTDLARFYRGGPGKDLYPSTCEGTRRSAGLLEEALAARGDRPNARDLFDLSLRGGLSEAYDWLSECAEGLGKADEAKALTDRSGAQMLGMWREMTRTRGETDRMTLVLGAKVAKWYDDHDRSADAKRMFDRVSAMVRRRYGESDPVLIDLELDFVKCAGGSDCPAEKHRQREALAQRALATDVIGGDAFVQYLYAALALRFQYTGKEGEFDAEVDAMLGRSADARAHLSGPQDAILPLAAQYALRKRRPALAAKAIEPARRIVEALNVRIAPGDGSLEREGDAASAEVGAIGHYLNFADAAWVSGGREDGSVRDEAYAALQRSTAGSVNRAMALSAAQRAADDRGGILGDLARRRATLAEQWASVDADVIRAVSAPAAGVQAPTDSLRRRDAVEQEVRAIDARLRAEFPEYFGFLHPEPLSVAATQAMLRPDEAILLAIPSSGGEGVHLLALSRTDVIWSRSTEPERKLQPSVNRLLWLAGADVGANAATERKWAEEAGPGVPFDRQRAYQLYQQLVAPVGGVLAGKRHVFVVAGGWLSRLPFGILVASPPSGDDGDPQALRATRWFADEHALSVIASVKALQLLRTRSHDRGQTNGAVAFVGFGDPHLNGVATERGGRTLRMISPAAVFRTGPDAQVEGRADPDILRRLNRLPGTALELENMRALFGAPASDLYLDDRATESAVKHADLAKVRVLAFATHGLLAGELRGDSEPGLVLTPPARGTKEDDGLLTASEIAGLGLTADWVILSACNTAAGDGSQGAVGLSGLARAFLHAGARALLVSHWPVRDDVASRLTVETVRLQRETPGLSRAEALQRAEREIRNDAHLDSKGDTWAHPNAWAPFSLVGDGSEGSGPSDATR
jgi:CHAT domain-containing protein